MEMRNYKGPAGPTEEQIQHNNKVLGLELKKLKIPFVKDFEFLKDLTGVEQCNPLLKIQHPNGNKDHVIYVGYDRWGFCLDHPKLEEDYLDIDQGELEETLAAIKKWYGTTPD